MTVPRWLSTTRRGGMKSPSRPASGDELIAAWYPLRSWPEAAEVLGELKSRGCELAILSNGDRAMLEGIAGELTVELDHVFSTEDSGVYKPAPEVYDLPVDALGHRARGLSARRRQRQRRDRREIGGRRLLLEQPRPATGCCCPSSPPTSRVRICGGCWTWFERGWSLRRSRPSSPRLPPRRPRQDVLDQRCVVLERTAVVIGIECRLVPVFAEALTQDSNHL